MRSTTTQEAKVLAAQERSNYLRVKTKNAAGAFIDLTTLRGYNWVKSADWSESLDNYVATANVALQRENELLSLANLVAASVLNSGGPLIEIARELTIETATMPLGVAPGAADWHIVFHGYIDEIDWNATPITLTCRDQAGQLLQDAQIEVERAYGVWDKSRAILLGQVCSPSGNPPNGQPTTQPEFWKCTTAGTTGATEPAWPNSPAPGTTQTDGTVVWTYQAAVAWSAGSSRAVGAFTANPTNTLQYWQCTAITTGVTGGSNPFPATPTQGQLVTDGGVTWQYYASLGGTPAETIIQSIINDTLGAGVVTLNVPAASNWFIGPFTQSRDKLFSALSALSEQMGWDLRFAWSQSAGDYTLTLQSVPRSAPAVAWTFAASSYFDVTKLARAVENIRNAVGIVFADSEHVDATTGQPLRNTVVVSDATSMGKYRRRYMEIAEAAGSGISTTAMATVFANAALSDLKEPLVEAEVELPYFWAIQLNDYVTLKANRVHFDSDQSVAVVTIKHTFAGAGSDGSGTERTTLGLRGLPTAGSQKHLDKEVGGAAPAYSLKLPAAASGLSVVAGIRGGRVSFSLPAVAGSKYLVAELHLSTVNGFTPSIATRRDWGLKTRFDFADLTPGTTYYAVILLRDQRGNVAAKSAQQSFVADQVQTADIANLAITDAQVNDVATTKLTGTISAPQLTGQIRQNFKYKLTADATLTNDGSINFGTRVIDTESIVTGGTIAPFTSAHFKLHIQLQLRGASVTGGCRAQIYVKDNSGAVVHATRWADANTSSDGTWEVIPVLDTQLTLIGGRSYTVYAKLTDADGALIINQTMKAESLAAAPYLSGTYFEGLTTTS